MVVDLSVLRSDRPLGRLVRSPLRLLPKNLVVPILQGPLRGRRWIVGASVHGCWLGWYERPKQLAFAAAVRPGAVVYDIGANVGFYTLLSSILAGPQGRVYAFEPVPRNAALLRRHVVLNDLRNVDVLELAVGERAGRAMFDDTLGHSQGRLDDTGRLPVSVVALDAMEAAGVLRPPDVLKIDVEGAKGAVLKGSRRLLETCHPTVFLATHGPAQHEECLATLRGLGYRVVALDGGPPDNTDELVATRPQQPGAPTPTAHGSPGRS
jgi:FkbM family methyltransferase